MKNYAKQSEERTEKREKKFYFISQKNEQQMDFMLLFKCLFPSTHSSTFCLTLVDVAVVVYLSPLFIRIVEGGQKKLENIPREN